ncbi:MAG TPA: ATP-binding protein [Stellaceae bacterium]|nr:ATP-binding protein [Stellaceae bacterium]
MTDQVPALETPDVTALIEAGEIGTWDWDFATGRMWWSAQMFRNLRLDPHTRGDLYGLLIEIIDPAEREAAIAALQEARRRVGAMRIEVKLNRPNREPGWVVFLGRTFPGPDGTPAHMGGITIDSTRRRKAEEATAAALQESERRLREVNQKLQERAERGFRELGASRAQMQAIFDNSPDWLTLFHATKDGRFVYADLNRATEKAYGLSYDQIVGRTVEDILGVEQAQLPLRMMRACIATGENQRYTARRTLAAVTRSIDVMFVRVPEQRDGDYYIMSTARDTTERDAIEAKLHQAQKMEAVGQLTGGLAHDFNNLLTSVIGNLELLEPKVAGDAAASRYVAAAARSAQTGAKLTEQLLAFARRQHLEASATDLNRVIRGMGDLLARSIGPAIRIETVLGPQLAPVLVDPTQIEVAILNLALNARDAMPSGGRLTIETRNADRRHEILPPEIRGARCVRVTIRDSGTGMSDDVLQMAIEPFFTTKEPGRGSGLGLSQVYGMVQQSGGAMRIDTALGKGTAIHLFLPQTDAAVAAGAGEGPLAALERREPAAHILVVDDDESVRQVAEAMLLDIGYSVAVAGSGQAGLDAIASKGGFDLLMIDIVMPGLSGIDTVRHARELVPGLRVLYMSGYAEDGMRRHTGPDPVIAKPFRLPQLGAAVRAALGESD